jgi:hypothetical protein
VQQSPPPDSFASWNTWCSDQIGGSCNYEYDGSAWHQVGFDGCFQNGLWQCCRCPTHAEALEWADFPTGENLYPGRGYGIAGFCKQK